MARVRQHRAPSPDNNSAVADADDSLPAVRVPLSAGVVDGANTLISPLPALIAADTTANTHPQEDTITLESLHQQLQVLLRQQQRAHEISPVPQTQSFSTTNDGSITLEAIHGQLLQ